MKRAIVVNEIELNYYLQHVLDSVFEGDDGAWTTCAAALHLQLDDAVLEAHVQNVTSVFLENK